MGSNDIPKVGRYSVLFGQVLYRVFTSRLGYRISLDLAQNACKQSKQVFLLTSWIDTEESDGKMTR